MEPQIPALGQTGPKLNSVVVNLVIECLSGSGVLEPQIPALGQTGPEVELCSNNFSNRMFVWEMGSSNPRIRLWARPDAYFGIDLAF